MMLFAAYARGHSCLVLFSLLLVRVLPRTHLAHFCSWPTGGWGSLEYGSAKSPGSLRGGRWKPMHYWFLNHMFQDVMSACGFVGRSHTFACYVSNARPSAPFAGSLSLSTIDLQSGASAPWATFQVAAAAGPGALTWFYPNATLPNASTTLLIASLTENTSDVAATAFDTHVVHLTAPLNLIVEHANVSATVADQPNQDGSVDISVTADAVALFVTLTTAAPGRFSDNAFLLLPAAPYPIKWIPFMPGNSTMDWELLKSTLRVEDHSVYAAV